MTTTAPPILRPRRRSLLVGSALLGTLALSSCDEATPEQPTEPERPRVSLEFEQMVTDSALWPKDGTRKGAWAVSPGSQRPMSLLLHHEDQFVASLKAVTLDSGLARNVQVGGSALGFVADGHAETVRVVARSVRDGHYRHLLMTSPDLETWETAALPDDVDCALVAAGGGLIASGVMDDQVLLWDLADDGAVTALPAVTVPEAQEWAVEGVQRAGETIVLLGTVRHGAERRIPMTVTSSDNGTTWRDPVALPSEAGVLSADQVLVAGSQFLVIGEQDEMSEVAPGQMTTRPTAWSSADGITFVQESIPLPIWGLEGWRNGDTPLDPDAPIDWLDIGHGAAVLDADREVVHLMVFSRDDPRLAVRSAQGEWTVSALRGTTMRPVYGGVADPLGWVAYSDIWVHGRSAEEVEGPEAIYNVSFARPRQVSTGRTVMGTGVSALLVVTEGLSIRTEQRIATAVFFRVTGMTVAGTEITASRDLPAEVTTNMGVDIDQTADGMSFLAAETFDPNAMARQESLVWASADGITWEPATGLPVEEVGEVVAPTAVGDAYYLPTAREETGEDGAAYFQASMYSSADGTSWELVAGPPTEEGGPREAAIESVADVAGSVVGLGFVSDHEDVRQAATFTLAGGELAVHPVDGAGAGSYLSRSTAVGGEVHA